MEKEKKKMKTVYALLLVLSLAVICVSSQAATVVNLTFDHGVMYPSGPADYTAAANEVLPAGVHGSLLSWAEVGGRATGNLVESDGPQGGQALNMMMSGSWPNKQGYYFGRDNVAAGDNYFMGQTYPTYTDAMQIGDPMPVISGEFTIKAVIKPDYTPNVIDFGKTAFSVIYDSHRLDGVGAGTTLWIDQNTGLLNYGPYWDGPNIVSSYALAAGQWYEILVVSQASGHVDLYIDGVFDGNMEGGPTALTEYFTIGTSYWPCCGWNFQGQIDAFSIDDTALLGPVPEPASIVTLAIGMLGVCGSIRRRARK
jgi:hypothetical protein